MCGDQNLDLIFLDEPTLVPPPIVGCGPCSAARDRGRPGRRGRTVLAATGHVVSRSGVASRCHGLRRVPKCSELKQLKKALPPKKN